MLTQVFVKTRNGAELLWPIPVEQGGVHIDILNQSLFVSSSLESRTWVSHIRVSRTGISKTGVSKTGVSRFFTQQFSALSSLAAILFILVTLTGNVCAQQIPEIPTEIQLPSIPPIAPPTIETPEFNFTCSDFGSDDPECASLPIQLPCIDLPGQQPQCQNLSDPAQRVFNLNINQFTTITQITNSCSSLPSSGGVLGNDLLTVCQQINGFDATNAVDVANLQSLLNGVLPEEAFSVNNTIVYASNYQVTEVVSRLHSIRSGATQPRTLQNRSFFKQPGGSGWNITSFDLVGINDSADLNLGVSGGLASPWGAFANASLSDGELDGAQFEQTADLKSSNITAGFDYRVSDAFVLGTGIGFASNTTDFTQSAGGAESTGVNFTLFGTLYQEGVGYLDAVIDVGVNSHDLERSVDVSPELRTQAFGNTDSSLVSFSLGGGRDLNFGAWDLGGFFRLLFSTATVDAYSETANSSESGSSFIYSFAEQSISSNRFALGGRLSRTISTRSGVFIPEIRVEVETETEETKDELTATLLSTNDSLLFQGSRRDASYANIGIGLSAVMRGGTSAFLFYESRQQHDFVEQNWIRLGLKVEL